MVVVKKIIVGMLETNCYVIYDDMTKVGACIDPGGSKERILSFVQEEGITIQEILLTHGHFDHVGALSKVKENTNATVHIGKFEKTLLSKPEVNLSSQFGVDISLTADHYLEDQEIIRVGDMELVAIYTPGHTKGGVCFYLEKEHILFSGDTLFQNSVGRTDFPTGNMEELSNSIHRHLFALPDDVKVYPGHGNETMIGYEKKSNRMI